MAFFIAAVGNTDFLPGAYYIATTKVFIDDAEVTQRPYIWCTWNGTDWDYPLPEVRAWQKDKFSRALESDLNLIFLQNNIGSVDTISWACGVHEINRLADNPSATDQETPLLKGYATYGSISKATAAADIASDVQYSMAAVGQLYAYKRSIFSAIDASTNYADILAMDYARPF